MKKQALIITLATIIIAAVGMRTQAQVISVTTGLKGGLTMSNLYIDQDDIDDENARFGFHLGIFSQIMFVETIGFQPEILFNTKGTRTTYSGIINQDVDFNLNYIDIPLMLVYRPLDVLEFQAGPYFGFLLNSNVAYSGLIDGQDDLGRDNFNAFELGVGAGLQLNFTGFHLGFRYNLGLTDIANSNAANLLLGNSKNSFAQVYIAFGLPRFF
jgi:hypothetical protein